MKNKIPTQIAPRRQSRLANDVGAALGLLQESLSDEERPIRTEARRPCRRAISHDGCGRER